MSLTLTDWKSHVSLCKAIADASGVLHVVGWAEEQAACEQLVLLSLDSMDASDRHPQCYLQCPRSDILLALKLGAILTGWYTGATDRPDSCRCCWKWRGYAAAQRLPRCMLQPSVQPTSSGSAACC